MALGRKIGGGPPLRHNVCAGWDASHYVAEARDADSQVLAVGRKWDANWMLDASAGHWDADWDANRTLVAGRRAAVGSGAATV